MSDRLVTPRPKGGKRKRTPKATAQDARDRAYLAWQRDQLAGRAWCEAGSAITARHPSHRCGRSASQLHHRRRRGRGGALCMVENTVAICTPCHDWVHRNTGAARALGLLVTSADADWAALAEVA